MRPVQGWDREQIEHRERQVDRDPVDEHVLQDGDGLDRARGRHRKPVERDDNERAEDGQDQVRGDSSQGDGNVPFFEVPVPPRVHGDGLSAPENRRPAQIQNERQDDGHEGVDMLDRVPGQPAELICRGVTIFVGNPAVGVFVCHHR